MLQHINESSNHLLNLINDVLDIAKIEANRLPLISESIHLEELIQVWERQTSVLASERQLDFQVKTDPNLPSIIYGDRERLTQIANNLLSNAIKFTKEGHVILQIDKEEEDWKIQVSDTGIGIAPEALDYIFEEFRQVDGSHVRAYGGTGLGLTIVQKLVTMMDGEVKIQSELEKGTTVTVRLPLKIKSISTESVIQR